MNSDYDHINDIPLMIKITIKSNLDEFSNMTTEMSYFFASEVCSNHYNVRKLYINEFKRTAFTILDECTTILGWLLRI